MLRRIIFDEEFQTGFKIVSTTLVMLAAIGDPSILAMGAATIAAGIVAGLLFWRLDAEKEEEDNDSAGRREDCAGEEPRRAA